MKLNTDNLNKEKKKLKKYYIETRQLENILLHLRNCKSYKELYCHPLSKMYGFEELKHEMTGYISFNLCKNGGVIRLICSFDKNNNIMKIEFISKKHYKDFKEKIG